MATRKRKLSISLDDDLVTELEEHPEAISAQVNAAVRNEIEARRRHRSLGALLDHLTATSGPLNSAKDEREIARYMRLLGGEG